MNYDVRRELTGEGEEYVVRRDGESALVAFCCEWNVDGYRNPTIVETSESFLKKLNVFPLYAHILCSYEPNLSTAEASKTIVDGTWHVVRKITDSAQLKEAYKVIARDVYNGETVILTSEATALPTTSHPSQQRQIPVIDFTSVEHAMFFLIMQLDGECWDFLSNRSAHPFERLLVTEE